MKFTAEAESNTIFPKTLLILEIITVPSLIAITMELILIKSHTYTVKRICAERTFEI